MDTNEVLNWIKNFKDSWLPNHISNNTQLIESISNKLDELEQILDNNHEHHSDSPFVLTSLDIHQSINDENQQFSRPAIRIKRISLAEAKRFLPPGWEAPKAQVRRQRGRKKSSLKLSNRKRKRTHPSQTYDETTLISIDTHRTSIENQSSHHSFPNASNTKNPCKQKRKLRAIDGEDDDLNTLGNRSQAEHAIDECEQISRYIGQHGLLSQTRRTNETMPTFDDRSDSAMKFISNLSTTNNELVSSSQTSTINNNNSILHYEVCVEDITNDGIDAPSSTPFEQLSLTT